MKNEVKAHLESGQKVYGTFLWSASEAIVESLGYSGLEFIVIDSEHSPIDTEGAVRMIRTAKLRNLTPIVRVKEHSRTAVLKMLDAGAEGLVIPCLHSADEVRRIVEYGKYAPLGERGFAQGRQAGYGFEPWLLIYLLTLRAAMRRHCFCRCVKRRVSAGSGGNRSDRGRRRHLCRAV